MMNPTRGRRLARGITLVEVMVAGSVLSIVLLGAMMVLMGVNKSAERVRRIGDAQTGSRGALDALEMELRTAGIGASRGHVGIAPAGGAFHRVPIVYSEADRVITTPGSAQVTSSSVFVISAEPPSVGVGADGSGMQGVVTAFDGNTKIITVLCSNAAGTTAACNDSSYGSATLFTSTGAGAYSPLLVSTEFHWASLISPTQLTANAVDPTQTDVTYTEQSSPSFRSDMKSAIGLDTQSYLLRARITHWYIWQNADGTTELRRSRPTLRAAAFSTGTCSAAESPFVDETNGGTAVGVSLGSAPIEGMLVRYVLGAADGSDTPATWTVAANPIGACDWQLAEQLREVRVGVISRTSTPDLPGSSGPAPTYTPPPVDGVSLITNMPVALAPGVLPTTTQVATISDSYPRRTFFTRVAPRNALGYLP